MIDFILMLKTGLVFSIFSWLAYLIIQRRKLVKKLSNIPGPPAYPILGNLELFKINPSDSLILFKEWRKKYGEFIIYWVGPDPVVLVTDPEIINLISNTGKFADKSNDYRNLEQYAGHNSLLTAAGDYWYHKRKLLNPCFHRNVIESFNDTVNIHSRKFIHYLKKYADTKESFNFMKSSKLITLDILMETMMGLELNLLEDETNSYLLAIQKVREIIVTRAFSLFHRSDLLFNYSNLKKEGDKAAETIRQYVRDVITAKREERKRRQLTEHVTADGFSGIEKEEKDSRKAILDMFLDIADGGNPISDSEMENEINTFIFAGHDTTSVALSYFLYAMGKYPEIQDKVVKEITEKKLNFLKLDETDVSGLEYFNRCLKESMRLFSPIPIIGKILHEPLKTRTSIIPSGVNINISLYSMQTNEKFYPNPDVFDPDRFLPENIMKSIPHSYMPFASGMRNCIGQKFAMMELKILLVYIIAHYKIEAMDSVEDLKISADIVLTPKNGLYLKLESRHPSFLF